MNNTVRFIEAGEVNELIREMFSIDRTLIREIVSDETLTYIIENWIIKSTEPIYYIICYIITTMVISI